MNLDNRATGVCFSCNEIIAGEAPVKLPTKIEEGDDRYYNVTYSNFHSRCAWLKISRLKYLVWYSVASLLLGFLVGAISC